MTVYTAYTRLNVLRMQTGKKSFNGYKDSGM